MSPKEFEATEETQQGGLDGEDVIGQDDPQTGGQGDDVRRRGQSGIGEPADGTEPSDEADREEAGGRGTDRARPGTGSGAGAHG